MSDVFEVAEASGLYTPRDPGEQVLDRSRYVLVINDPHRLDGSSVQRIRTTAFDLESTRSEIQAELRACSAIGANWEISSEATPVDLVDRLLDLGLCWAEVPLAVVMALDEAPKTRESDVVVRRVTTVDDFKVHVTVSHTAFDKLDRLPAELARIDEHGGRDLESDSFVRYTAFIDGGPAGIATATFTPVGVMLHSGCTLPALRGRGVYGALVAHRWQAAVARGTPRVVTRAGPMSRPILANLGFRELGELRFLVDELS